MCKNYKCIKNGKIILENEVLENKAIIFDDKIVDIFEEEQLMKYKENFKIDEIIDAGGKYISPGFIDIHIHGSGGKDTMDAEESALETISRTIVKNGVTGFLPTTMTMSRENIYKALDTIKNVMKKDIDGAKILGAHMEGPFISEKYKGAQKSDYILKPSFEFIKDYLDVIKIITMAPEEDNEYSFVKKVKNNSDIILSMGHTNTDYKTAMEAIRYGISHATHTFNAMTPLNHREPGAVGAILNTDITFEIIADTIHVDPAIFQTMLNAKGKEKMILITDSMRAGCMNDGNWELGGQKVIVENNSARLQNGTLAGSILKLNTAIFNILKYTDLKIYEAVALATLNPARLLNLNNTKGSIKIGKCADLVIFDKEFNVNLTISEGKIIYRN